MISRRRVVFPFPGAPIQGSPDVNFTYRHVTEDREVTLSTEELREILGDISLAEPEILSWIGSYLGEQYGETKNE